MMRIIFLILILSFVESVNAQSSEGIYRVESKMESPGIATYNVSVLKLYKDGVYEIMRQKYRTRKLMKKNVISLLDREHGTWEKKMDTLYLNDSKNNQIIKFFVKSKNKIALVIEDLEVSTLNWRKVK